MLKASAFCGAAVAAFVAGASVLAAAPAPAIPTGARLEPSGFASIDVAPVTPAQKPKRDDRPQGEAGFYALDNGISQAEAMKRIDAQNALRPEFERLLATLRARE